MLRAVRFGVHRRTRHSRWPDAVADVAAVSLNCNTIQPWLAKEVVEGEMCGMSLKTTKKIELQEGDHIDLFSREAVQRKL